MNGAKEEFSDDDKKWFVKVREAVGEDEIIDFPTGYIAQDLGSFSTIAKVFTFFLLFLFFNNES